MFHQVRHLKDEAATIRLGAEIALWLGPGDFVALKGGLGAGKTTLARAVLRTMADDPWLEVPSPTFTLVQAYDQLRVPVAHLDLYRVESAGEIDELGLDDAQETGAVLVEWPDRLGSGLPADRLEVGLTVQASGGRTVRLEGHGAWDMRLRRQYDVATFLAASGWGNARRHWLKGDASTRAYERLRLDENGTGRSAVLMNAPPMAEPPEVSAGSYSETAHLARDVVPFLAIGQHLRGLGLSAPEILAADAAAGLLLLEDLGDGEYARLARAGHDMDEPYEAAVQALSRLHAAPPPVRIGVEGAGFHRVPAYDLDAFLVEAELLVDWTWPALTKSTCPGDARQAYRAAWTDLFMDLKGPEVLVLRDFHSPNLIWLPGRTGAARAGIIDHQDAVVGHPAYDLVALAQDARIDVAPDREERLVAAYLEARPERVDHDEAGFRAAYAVLGAQRAAKIVGIFTRLAHRDGKPDYLQHLPRVAAHLSRNLRHPALAAVAAWTEKHFGSDMSQRICGVGAVR